MPSREDLLLALVDAHAANRTKLEERVAATLVALWGRFDGWYVPHLVAEAAAQAADLVGAGQVGVAGITDDYLARTTTLIRHEPVSPIGVNPSMRSTLRAGVTGPEVYERVAQEFRWQFFRGVDVDEARQVATVRAREMSAQDLGLAFQRQTADFTQKRRVALFRRVTRHEGTCGLCVAASHHVYTRGDLLPIHARCRCSVIAADGDLGGGSVTSDETWAKLQGTALSLSARDLKDVRYVVDDHGELGPVLRNANQRISRVRDGRVRLKGPQDPEAKMLDPAHGISTMTAEQIDRAIGISEKSLTYARTRGLDRQVRWHTARMGLLTGRRAELASV